MLKNALINFIFSFVLAEKEKVYSQQLNIKTILYLQNEAMYKEKKEEEREENKK